MTQEMVAFAAVALAAGFLGLRFAKRYLAEPLSRFLLKKNRVRAAMWVNSQISSSCEGCSIGGSAASGPLQNSKPTEHSGQNG